MIELQEIKNRTTWNDAASAINNNNAAIQIAIAKLQSKQGGEKGYFPSIDALQQALPDAVNGDIAYVGGDYPYEIYQYSEENGWTSTGLFGGIKGLGATQVRIGNQTFDAQDGVVEINSFSHVTRGISPVSGEEIDLGSQGNSFNQIYASEFIEGSKSLSERYLSKDAAQATFATKQEAYDFVNVGEKDGLENAIKSIPSSYRMSGQVVTFVDASKKSLCKQTLQITRVDIVNIGSDVEMFVKIGDRESDTFVPSANAISPEDGRIDYNKLNEELYEFIKYSDDLRDLLQSAEYSDITGVGMGIYTLTAAAKDAKLSIRVYNNATIQYDVVTLANYAEGEATSYQYMALSTSESSYLDTINWAKYKGEGAITWKGF